MLFIGLSKINLLIYLTRVNAVILARIRVLNPSKVGYVKNDGTVQDKNHSTLGYIKNDETVQDKNHSTIGYAKGIDMYWTAVTFFFFDLQSKSFKLYNKSIKFFKVSIFSKII